MLSFTVKEQTIDEEVLHTLMCEVKRLSTANPSQEALNPNYVLLMKAKTLLPPGLFDKNDIYNPDVACSKSSTWHTCFEDPGLRII